MRTVWIPSIIIVFLLLSSCASSYQYLYNAEYYQLNPRGSYLTAKTSYTKDNALKPTTGSYKGELICVDSTNLYLLHKDNEHAVISTVQLTTISQFSLKYAREKNIVWTIPVYSLATISHGWFLVFTFPINLITTAVLASKSNKDYRFTNKNFSVDELYKFARFPQGLPDGIDLTELK